MTLFLQIVAGFVVAIVLVAAMVLFWLRRKIRKLGGNLMEQVMERMEANSAGGEVPPFRMHLKTADPEELDYEHDDDVERLADEFYEAGFETICDFEVVELPLALRAFRHAELNAYGVVYDHPLVGAFCDVTRRYQDQSSWTVSSSRYHGMDPVPGSHPVFLPEANVQDLVDRLVEDSPVNGILPATRDDFVVHFESAYAREMNFRIERGGPTEQEIRRIAEITGQECDQEQVDAVQKQWKIAISEFLSQKAIAMWKKEQDVPTPVFNRLLPQLVAIHNRWLPEQLMALVCPEFDLEAVEDEEFDDAEVRRHRTLYQKLITWMNSMTAAEAFQKLLNVSGAASRWQHQGSAARPVPAEIWLQPLDDDEDDRVHHISEYDEELDV